MSDHLDEARSAIQTEWRHADRAIPLECRQVQPVSLDEALFKLEVGSVDFDWTWEGAAAFPPLSPLQSPSERWFGQIVEVDEDEGWIFIACEGQVAPVPGPFLVKPFAFLENLHRTYNNEPMASLFEHSLETALLRSLGRVPPSLEDRPVRSTSLEVIWKYPWSAIWGPPGTGKTYTIGQEVARLLAHDPDSRILVVSTTNKATDGAALSAGRALLSLGGDLSRVVRPGVGAGARAFQREGLEGLLKGSKFELRRLRAELEAAHTRARTSEERARLQTYINKILPGEPRPFLDERYRAVVCTSHYAMKHLLTDELLKSWKDSGPPFEVVIVDEASMISRAAAAALSLLSCRYFILVGDPRQLAPISRVARILPGPYARWLGKSGLDHLGGEALDPLNVHFLDTQRRMCPEIRDVVSYYQYGGRLKDAPQVLEREFERDDPLKSQPRAIWYVLDEEDSRRLHRIRAVRGPNNRSWLRPVTRDVLEKLARTHKTMAAARLFYLSPFKAQVKDIRTLFASQGPNSWEAATVHSQQGAEADTVIFDTVNASSVGWPVDEWMRLVNVAMSRARHQLILLASRREMKQPYLEPLQRRFAPRYLNDQGCWEAVAATEPRRVPRLPSNDQRLGAQLESRRHMLPVLSHEQERLVNLSLDGRPRLVRGVAGSGKTWVLANWLARTLNHAGFSGKAWVVYGNLALRGLLQDFLSEAWRALHGFLPIPWDSVEMLHVSEVLRALLAESDLDSFRFDPFDYESMSAALLETFGGKTPPHCQALFIDEAQDLGNDTLRLLCDLVEATEGDPNSRAVLIFYDNAQNVYKRGTPRWKEFGLDMRGRSTIMKESFRSTKPISEFALNVMYRLWSPEKDADSKELVDLGLIEPVQRNKRTWWTVHFNESSGPLPEFQQFVTRRAELNWLAGKVRELIRLEAVRPSDIKIISLLPELRNKIVDHLQRTLPDEPILVEQRTSRGDFDESGVLVVTTPHSFKGYEAEIIFLAGIDLFKTRSDFLTPALYVAMTRARSLLFVSGVQSPDSMSGEILQVMQSVFEDQQEPRTS